MNKISYGNVSYIVTTIQDLLAKSCEFYIYDSSNNDADLHIDPYVILNAIDKSSIYDTILMFKTPVLNRNDIKKLQNADINYIIHKTLDNKLEIIRLLDTSIVYSVNLILSDTQNLWNNINDIFKKYISYRYPHIDMNVYILKLIEIERSSYHKAMISHLQQSYTVFEEIT